MDIAARNSAIRANAHLAKYWFPAAAVVVSMLNRWHARIYPGHVLSLVMVTCLVVTALVIADATKDLVVHAHVVDDRHVRVGRPYSQTFHAKKNLTLVVILVINGCLVVTHARKNATLVIVGLAWKWWT